MLESQPGQENWAEANGGLSVFSNKNKDGFPKFIVRMTAFMLF